MAIMYTAAVSKRTLFISTAVGRAAVIFSSSYIFITFGPVPVDSFVLFFFFLFLFRLINIYFFFLSLSSLSLRRQRHCVLFLFRGATETHVFILFPRTADHTRGPANGSPDPGPFTRTPPPLPRINDDGPPYPSRRFRVPGRAGRPAVCFIYTNARLPPSATTFTTNS